MTRCHASVDHARVLRNKPMNGPATHSRYRQVLWCLPGLLVVPSTATAIQFHTSHSDPVAPVILGVTAILFVALLGRFGARKLGLPSVLGELTMGIVIGNLAYVFGYDLITILREGPAVFKTVENLLQGESLEQACSHALGDAKTEYVLGLLRGPHGNELLQVSHALDVFSRYGIIFLLFMVGLRSDFYRRMVLRTTFICNKDLITADYVENVTRAHKVEGSREAMLKILRRQFFGELSDEIRRLGEMGVPILLVWGRQDRGVPLSCGEEMHRILKGSRLEVLDRAGHCPQYEHAQEFNEMALDFPAESG